MKIYDITQELFSAKVYPGDRAPAYRRVAQIKQGDICNITELEMNVHNGTHVDAPRHFFEDGAAVDQLDLEAFVGPCLVRAFQGPITEADILSCRGVRRLLCKGDAFLTEEGAKALVESDIRLIGVESQSIAPVEAPAAIHRILLEKGIVILEGLDLQAVKAEDYTLFAAPLKLGGSDGAPCRAILIEGTLQ